MTHPLAPDSPRRTPEEMEAEAGRLLAASAKARMDRAEPGDAHEVRHILAAVTAGNSDPCKGGACHLDHALMRQLYDANFTDREPSPAMDYVMRAAWAEGWEDPAMAVYDDL